MKRGISKISDDDLPEGIKPKKSDSSESEGKKSKKKKKEKKKKKNIKIDDDFEIINPKPLKTPQKKPSKKKSGEPSNIESGETSKTKVEPKNIVKTNVIIDIINHWEKEFGTKGAWEKALNFYDEAIQESTKWSDNELKDIFDKKVWNNLMKNKISTNILKIINIDKQIIYEQWLKFSKLDECLIYQKDNLDRYPTRTVRTVTSSGRQFPFHQFPIRRSEYEETGKLQNWPYEMVASHLCHSKQCLTCCIKEHRKYNTHRNDCVAFIIVDTKLHWICKHTPQCKIFGNTAILEKNM
jgi:hypothetical protein